jgi:protein-S-isoprenylcysteine O-methyltransferase Ste14
MSLFTLHKRKLLGTVLVVLQFGLLAGLAVLASPQVVSGAIPWGPGVLAGTSIALAAWTLIHNRPGNFNIRPTPKSWGTLITSGPYRHIRHPMYTSVLLGAAALAVLSTPLQGWLAWTALAGVLGLKSSFEERWMREQHPGYGAYAQETKRFLPWLF